VRASDEKGRSMKEIIGYAIKDAASGEWRGSSCGVLGPFTTKVDRHLYDTKEKAWQAVWAMRTQSVHAERKLRVVSVVRVSTLERVVEHMREAGYTSAGRRGNCSYTDTAIKLLCAEIDALRKRLSKGGL
jgi:hypothetical protein